MSLPGAQARLLGGSSRGSPVSIPINPLVTNVLSNPYYLDESTFILGTAGVIFQFSMKFMSTNRKVSDGTPRFAATHLGLFCMHMSHKKDAKQQFSLYELMIESAQNE